MLPQGLFSVAIATILFPTLARLAARADRDSLRRTMANGVRQIALLLIPSAVIMAVLAEPITRLVYERGEFDAAATDLVAEAMLWWALSLPFQGISLLFSRTYFSLQKPWTTTALAGLNLVVNAVAAALLYKPFGVAGIVVGTVIGTVGMTVAQGLLLRPDLGGVEGRETLSAGFYMLIAGGLLGILSWATWAVLDDVLGRALIAQAVSVGAAIAVGLVAYAGLVWAMQLDEARQIQRLFADRLRRPGTA
jgi:putative peptidoglycan lipid II flippase